jgi:N-methylhydantoinase B
MAVDLQRTSYNMIIYEVRDFCTALVTPEGELVSQNVGGVSHFIADLGIIITDGMQRYVFRLLSRQISERSCQTCSKE